MNYMQKIWKFFNINFIISGLLILLINNWIIYFCKILLFLVYIINCSINWQDLDLANILIEELGDIEEIKNNIIGDKYYSNISDNASNSSVKKDTLQSDQDDYTESDFNSEIDKSEKLSETSDFDNLDGDIEIPEKEYEPDEDDSYVDWLERRKNNILDILTTEKEKKENAKEDLSELKEWQFEAHKEKIEKILEKEVNNKLAQSPSSNSEFDNIIDSDNDITNKVDKTYSNNSDNNSDCNDNDKYDYYESKSLKREREDNSSDNDSMESVKRSKIDEDDDINRDYDSEIINKKRELSQIRDNISKLGRELKKTEKKLNNTNN